MSHQTGIKASDELEKFFSVCKKKDVRTLAISIEDERLVKHSWHGAVGGWEEDYSSQVPGLLQEKTPRYVLFRLGGKRDTDEWLLLLWSPEDSPIRQKMLYASTKATLKRQFGGAGVSVEVFATCREEATLEAVRGARLQEEGPLTAREEELADVRRVESVEPQRTVAGVACGVDRAVAEALRGFVAGRTQYLRLRINLSAEQIELDHSCGQLPPEQLGAQVPADAARYHLYSFDHSYEGTRMQSTVFVYSMPGYSCSIKERMIYSSSKTAFLDALQADFNITVAKKLEVGEGAELAPALLYEELHPPTTLPTAKFTRPKGPPGRGNRRITKEQ